MNNDKIYSKAYKEVYELIKCLSEEEKNKIPKKLIELIKTNMDKNYKYEVKSIKNIRAQKMLPETEAIIAVIYRDYLATPEKKKKIMESEKRELEQIEKRKRERYNPDNLFKK